MVNGTKKPDGGVNVDAGDDEFLNTKRSHLDALHFFERLNVAQVRCGVLAVRQHSSWYMEADSIHDDHCQDTAKDHPFPYDQVKP